MSDNAKKEIDWIKYIGLALAVASFFFFRARWEKNQEAFRAKQVAQQKQQAEEKKRADLKTQKEPDAQTQTKKKTDDPKVEDATKKSPDKAAPKSAEIKPEDPNQGTDKPKPPGVEPEETPADIKVLNPHLALTFSARGAGIASAWLADQYVTAQAKKENKPGLELLGRIDPKQITLGMPFAKFVELEFTDLEQRVWFLEKDSKGFTGADKVWTVAYSTTLHEPRSPWKPQCKVVKRFKIGQSARYVETEVEVVNLTEATGRFQYTLRGAAGIFMDGPKEDPKQDTSAYVFIKSILAGRRANVEEPELAIVTADKVATLAEEDRRIGATGGNLWATLSNRFFVTVMIARKPDQIVSIKAETLKPDTTVREDERYKIDNQSVVFETLPTRDLEASGKLADGYCFFMGPMKEDLLAECEGQLALDAPVRLDLAMQFCDVFGWRWPNIDRLSWLLMVIFRFIAEYAGFGVAVILLTLVVKVALHWFSRKSQISMLKMQTLQPKLKAIEKKYEGQTKPEMKQKKEMEKWDLMKKEGANPVSGCLPMLIQMPIFFALYGIFRGAFETRQATFWWIEDLSISDRLFPLGFWPNQFNLLPLIYVALSIIQMKLQPRPENPDPSQEMQRKMMSFMPVMFALIFYKMPAGLVLYFAAQSVFTFIESWYIKRFVLKVDIHGKPLAGSKDGDKDASKKAEPAKAGA
jgi:YidC/Oxa1 family membrane protein insertase